MDGREDEAAELRNVGDVAEKRTCLGLRVNLPVQLGVRRGRDDEEASVEIRCRVAPLAQLDKQVSQFVNDLRCDHGHPGAAVEETARLLERHGPAADDEAAPTFEVEARHVVALLRHGHGPLNPEGMESGALAIDAD
jgi:hypothetical protein